MSKMPTVGLVYIQTVSVRANVAKRHASKLSPSDLNLDAPNGNGPFLVWSAHVKLAQGIFDVLKAHFEAPDVSMSKVFYASDGESVVYSGGGGVPGLIQREVNPQATSRVCQCTACLTAHVSPLP
jgi:hypothetical protein